MDQDQSPARPQGGNASRSPSPRHDDEPRRTSRTEGRSSGTPERLDGARHLAAAFADSEPSQPRAVSMTGAQGAPRTAASMAGGHSSGTIARLRSRLDNVTRNGSLPASPQRRPPLGS